MIQLAQQGYEVSFMQQFITRTHPYQVISLQAIDTPLSLSKETTKFP
jgi:hypothetical protein